MKQILLICVLACTALSVFAQQRGNGTAPHHRITDRPEYPIREQSDRNTTANRPVKLTPAQDRVCTMDTLLFEDFESVTIPASWQNLDLDMRNDANGRPVDYFIQGTIITPADTNWFASSSSWFTPPGRANNWLITDQVNVCDPGVVLSWVSRPFEGPAFLDGYKVLVSTTNNQVGSFTDTIFVAAEDITGTGMPGPGNVHPSFDANGRGIFAEWSVSLAAYDGQDIYIAFVHDSQDDNLISFDNIFVGLPIENDLVLSQAGKGPSRYSVTPVLHTQAVQFGAVITNDASATQTNVAMDVEVFRDGGSVYSESVSAGTLAPGEDSVTIAGPYTPDTIGFYAVAFEAVSDAVDQIPGNNIDTVAFIISDSLYARDDNSLTGILSIGAGATGRIGQEFELFARDRLSSVTFFLNEPTVGDEIVVSVFDMPSGTPANLIAQTTPVTITAAGPQFLTAFIEGGPFVMDPGLYTIAVEEAADQELTLGYTNANFEFGATWVFFNNNWINSENANFFVTYLLRGTFIGCPAPATAFSSAIDMSDSLSVNFTNLTAGTGSETYAWDFADGNTSNEMSPSHSYAVAGTYDVCLTVTNECGDSTVCESITVTGCREPVAGIEIASVDSLTIGFADMSSTTGATSYLWNFGDGNTSTLEAPSHTYAADGTYTVCLTIADDCGTDSSCVTIMVEGCPVPVAGFDLAGINSFTVDFSNNSSVTGMATYLWNFGDGNTSTLEVPSHTYATEGSYEVCLTVDDVCGSNTSCDSVTITCPAPIADIGVNSIDNLTVDFSNNSVVTGVATYFWTFGDGNTTNFIAPSHTYAAEGTYVVCLTVNDDCGNTTTCDTIEVICPAPVAGIGIASINNLSVDFSNNSMATGAATYSWNFGDGNTSSMEAPSHTYAADGSYEVCLTVDDDCGSNTTCDSVTVACPAPVVAINIDMISMLTVDFSNTSTVSGAATYSWNFGDGNTSSMEAPSHTYAADGSYEVCLTVDDDCGSTTECDSVTVMLVSVDQQQVDNSLSVRPNPASDLVQIQWEGVNKVLIVQVVNATGQTVISQEVQPGASSIDLELNRFPTGIYRINMMVDGGTVTRPLVIQR